MKTATFSPEFHRHIYDITDRGMNHKDYQLREVSKDKILTDIIRIEKFWGLSNAKGISEYLRLYNASDWRTSEGVTGLRQSEVPRMFYGDRKIKDKRSLILMYFSEDDSQLCVDYYRSFYPKNPTQLKKLIKDKFSKKQQSKKD